MNDFEEAAKRLNDNGWNIPLNGNDNGSSSKKVIIDQNGITRISSKKKIPLPLHKLSWWTAFFLIDNGITTAGDLKEYIKKNQIKSKPGLRSLLRLKQFGMKSLHDLISAIRNNSKLSLDDFE